MSGKCRLFVSYASEDRESIARPLAEALSGKFEIWYDEFSLAMGDSLRKRIDEGLASCDFGIVILSKSFFGKNWPQMELNALVSRESTGQKRILPVWHNITRPEVAHFSPLLADRLGIPSSRALDEIVGEIEKAIEAERQRLALTGDPTESTQAGHRDIIGELVLPSTGGTLPSRVLGRELPRAAVDTLADVRRIEVSGQRPDYGNLGKAMSARSPEASKDAVADALLLVIQLLTIHGLVVISHDRLGYPYWNTSERGVAVLSEQGKDGVQ